MNKKPLNLTAYGNRTVEFIINGKLISIPELSYKDMKTVAEYEENESSTQADELRIVKWLLNKNTSGEKFTDEDIYALPAGAIGRIYRECVLLPRQALADPN